MKYIRSLAVLLLVIVAVSSFTACKTSGTEETNTSSVDESGQNEDTSVDVSSEQTETQTDGPVAVLPDISVTVEFIEPETGGDDPEMNTAADLVKQWISSQLSYDYARHFALFQRELVDSMFLPEVSGFGMTCEQAIAAIASHASELIPWDTCYFSFTFDDFHVPTESEKNEWLESVSQRFDEAGVDISAVKDVRTFAFVNVESVYGDEFCGESGYDHAVMWIYLYGDTWYLTPELMDVDFSVNLALAGLAGDDGYYKQKTVDGTVEWIHGDYARVGGVVLYFHDAFLIGHIAVGDTVSANCYSLGYRCSDRYSEEADTVELARVISFEITKTVSQLD